MTAVCEELAGELGEMFQCSPRGDFVRVRTPFWFPDGGVVDVFVHQRDHQTEVTDLGETLGWLRLQSTATRRSPKQQRLVQDTCMTLGVELFKGQLVSRAETPAKLAEAILRVGQAVIRVADLWFTMRTRAIESVSDEVADLLEEKKIAFDRGVKLVGRSGREWTVDFQTHTVSRSAFVFLLATGSRAAARRVTEHVAAGWYDLQGLRAPDHGEH
jgi:Domain of unknown function DUF1828